MFDEWNIKEDKQNEKELTENEIKIAMSYATIDDLLHDKLPLMDFSSEDGDKE